MRKTLLFRTRKVLAFVTLLMGLGCGQAMATTVGEADNTTTFWKAFSDYYTIAPDQTLTLEFTNYSSKVENWFNWTTVVTTDDDRDGANYSEYIVMRADCYGWDSKFNTNDNSTNWFKENLNNYDWGTFKDDLDGANVKLTVKRVGALVTLSADVTTTANKTYNHFFAMDCGDGSQTIRAFLTTDNSHLEIDDASVTITSTETASGTLIGDLGNTTAWWTAFSDSYVLQPNQALTFNFVNYSSKVNNWFNWVVYVTSDADRNDTANGYEEYMALRADNYDIVQGSNVDITSNYNWDTFRSDLDGAIVSMEVSRLGANITVDATIYTNGGNVYNETFTKTCGDGTQPIRAFLTTDHGHIDLLSTVAEANIGATGWATFCSSSALDFSDATPGLTAYTITGHNDCCVTLQQVTGIVPAGTPLLLQGESGDYFVPVAASAGAAPTNLLKAGTGAQVTAESGKTKYVLSVSGGKAVFQKIAATPAIVPAGKAYLEFSEEIASRELSFNAEATAISSVAAAQTDGAVYNLSGQRVSQATKGIYVKNGKKFINK